MSIFPKIETLKDIIPHIQGMEYIGVLDSDNGATVICYQISHSMAFQTMIEKECRGITFDDEGKIISRSMHKFFNVNERENYTMSNIDWTQVHAVYDKMDGSMINTGRYKGELFAKSKKSFKSPVAVSALHYINQHLNYIGFCNYCADIGVTPTFEYTSPSHRIVLDYKVEALTVLQIREMVSGRYYSFEEVHNLCELFDVSVNKPLWTGEDFDINKAVEFLSTGTELEGYVIQFKNGDMVKIKSNWYSTLHNAVTFVRERDIARLVLEETIDDFIAFLNTNRPKADLTRVNEINDEVSGWLHKTEAEVEKHVAECAGMTPKEVYMKFEGHPLQGFIARRFRGQTINYIYHYQQNLLSGWSLKGIDMGEISDFSSLG